MKHKVFVLSIILFLFPITAFAYDWTQMASGTTNNLHGIWGSSASDIFAVGDGGIILHYDGSNWSSMASGTTQDLKGVWGNSGTDVFAIGDAGTILRYNGSVWSAMQNGTTYDLNAVWGASSSDVFAVGECMNIIHFDGTAWSAMIESCCDGDYYCYAFNSVWGCSGADVYAMGRGYKTECLNHYDGTNWQCSGTPFGANNAIWGSSSADVFVAGIWIWHNNGSNWTRLQPNFSGHYYYGIWGNSAQDVFFVGTEGYIVHYNGTSFTPMSSGTTNHLKGVWGSSGNDVFAVGVSGTILHYIGSTFTTTVSLTTTTTTIPSTLIEFSFLIATHKNKKVILEWETESEVDNAGFNIYRSESEDVNYIKINTSLISAKGSSTEGASYAFTDKDVKNRKIYYYKLEDIDLNGASTMHGPVSATPRLFYWIGK